MNRPQSWPATQPGGSPAPAPLPLAARADISWQTCFPSCGSWPAQGATPFCPSSPLTVPRPRPTQALPLGPCSARGYLSGREGAVGAPTGRSRIISLRSLGALVRTPRQGHTKVSKQVWGRVPARPPSCVCHLSYGQGLHELCPPWDLPPLSPNQAGPQPRGPRVSPHCTCYSGLHSASRSVGAP